MQIFSSRLVLFIATLFLSFAAFIAFNLREALDAFQYLLKGELPEDIELLAFDFYQSVTVFVTGLFFTIFISQFEKIYLRLSKATELIPTIVREEVSKVTGPIQESFNQLTLQLANGMITQGEQLYRALEYERDTGILKNHSSDDSRAPRNILFNVNTACTIFQHIHEIDAGTLQTTGYRCGRSFLHNFRRLRDDIGDDLRKAIEAWIEYDANAGWGKFDVDWTPGQGKICITLKYNFLMEDDRYHQADTHLNSFLAGYIEGVFSAFPSEMLEKAGFNPAALHVDYEAALSRDNSIIYSPERGSRFCLHDGRRR